MVPRRGLHWPSLAILATGLLSVGPAGVFAQISDAVCLSSFGWMNNSKNQNPCVVSAYLQGACNGGQFNVSALQPNTHYVGPYADQQNPCQCSSVTYNTISACGLCQNRTIISWAAWDTNCTTIYPGVFLPVIPSGTAVPQWAFQDVSITNEFDVTLAQSVGDSPESTATNSQTIVSVISTSAPASLTSLPSTSATSSTVSSGNSSNTGAIAGGVIGGVVIVALIAGAVVFFVMKKKRSQISSSAQFAGPPVSSAYPSSGYLDANPFVPQMTQPRLYDPSDPSTFPVSPPPTTITNVSSNNVQSPAISYSSPSVHPGYYSGVPEV